MSVSLSGDFSLHSELSNRPIQLAVERLQRDWLAVFSAPLGPSGSAGNDQIRLHPFAADLPEESFRVARDPATNSLDVFSGGELGCVYAIHAISQRILGTDAFDFWTDSAPESRARITVSDEIEQAAAATRWRGWFINDEDCLLGLDESLVIQMDVWRGLFESILRAGYNLVIPGTGISPDAFQLDLAADYGLWIGQHHAEPLGADLFGNAFPGQPMHYPECKPQLFGLYEEAVQLAASRKVVWTLGLRGQGDKTFAHEDARYADPAALGALISEVAREQRALVESRCEGPQHFAYYLYSESMDLYRSGHLRLDPDVILIWADNGFGGLRRRRNLGEEKPELLALPNAEEAPTATHGLYYHLSFYDVQVAGKLTPWIAPAVIADQIGELQRRARIDFALVNVSNVRPFLAQIELFRRVLEADPAGVDTTALCRSASRDWWKSRCPACWESVVELEEAYFRAHPVFGPFPDSRMGEMAGHILLRALIRSALTHRELPAHLSFLDEVPDDLPALLNHLAGCVEPTISDWIAVRSKALEAGRNLSGNAATFFQRDLQMHCLFKSATFVGFAEALRGLRAYLDGEFESAFVLLNAALDQAISARDALRVGDVGRWEHFHRGDWLTNVEETIRLLTLARETARLHGDPGFSWDSWSSRAALPEPKHLVTVTARTFDSPQLAGMMAGSAVSNAPAPRSATAVH